MKPEERERARELRRQGLSIKEICAHLSVAKSSVSLWVRDISLTSEQIERLEQRRSDNRKRFVYWGREHGAKIQKQAAEVRHNRFSDAGYMRAKVDEEFRLICALYWGEGSKSSKTFRVANSD